MITNAMSVDVEDYFQVLALSPYIKRQDWDKISPRVEHNTNRVLDLFAVHNVKATFFTLGWVAERFPQIIKRIVAEGHELASHGYAHFLVTQQTPAEFQKDVRQAKQILEDVGGVAVKGYRAATFSITKDNLWAFDVLAEEGYLYSSSIYPVHHDFYGIPDAPRSAFHPIAGSSFIEIPMTTLHVMGKNFPMSGGGFFRLFPYSFTRAAMRYILRRDQSPCLFYFHPWEIDPGQPVQPNISLKTRIRHYLNLKKMESRLERLLQDFSWGRMDDIFLK